MPDRLKQFKDILKINNLDGFIVTNPYNILYLTGFIGVSPYESESILVFNPKPTLIAPKLYQTEALELTSKELAVKIVKERNEVLEVPKKLLSKCHKVGFEQESLSFSQYQEFKKALPGTSLKPFKNTLENLRLIKSAAEIKKIEKAQIISQKAFDSVIRTIKTGQTEEEVAHRLKSIIQELGGRGLSFESIIASGTNSGKPHHVSGKRKIKKGEILLFDFGAKYQGYCADLTRTVFIGRAKDRDKNIYGHVARAQKQAISKITNNIKSSDAYHAANDHFKKNGLHGNFTHGLGHGIGLEVHETPHLRPSIDDPLTENMVFSVEPGLYFPWGGVRIEDLVTIKNGKAKVLGKTVGGIIEI